MTKIDLMMVLSCVVAGTLNTSFAGRHAWEILDDVGVDEFGFETIRQKPDSSVVDTLWSFNFNNLSYGVWSTEVNHGEGELVYRPQLLERYVD